MQIAYTTSKPEAINADVLILPCFQARDPLAGYGYARKISDLLIKNQFTGEVDKAIYLPSAGAVRAKAVILTGLGKKDDLQLTDLRNALAYAMRSKQISRLKQEHIAIDLGPVLEQVCKGKRVSRPGGTSGKRYKIAHWAGQAVTEGAELGAYVYNKMRSRDSELRVHQLKKITLAVGKSEMVELKKGGAWGSAIAYGVNLARDMVNDPANHMRPGHMARLAQSLARKIPGLTTRVLNKKKIEELKMGSFLAVNAASSGGDGAARLICMEYKGGKRTDAPICLVGKGLTFDTGGYNLKPGASMVDMKMDMGGGAAVMGAICSVAKMKLPINVVAVVAATENMVSENATRPGDVVTSMSGITIEIGNTDAEGRLILADALTYAQKYYKPKTLIDVATLTGACMVALGNQLFALFSRDDRLAKELEEASLNTAELAWRMPMPKVYESYVNSTIADTINTGGRWGGAIFASLFLNRFVNKGQSWAHLDIAGVAMTDGRVKGVVPIRGATGVPVRTLVAFLRERAGA